MMNSNRQESNSLGIFSVKCQNRVGRVVMCCSALYKMDMTRMWKTVVFCFCVEDMEYFIIEPCVETDDSTVLKAADNELAGINDNNVMGVEQESECVTPGVLDLQPHETGDCFCITR